MLFPSRKPTPSFFAGLALVSFVARRVTPGYISTLTRVLDLRTRALSHTRTPLQFLKCGKVFTKYSLVRQKPILDREFDVEQVDIFQLQQIEEKRCFFFAQDETYFHRQV